MLLLLVKSLTMMTRVFFLPESWLFWGEGEIRPDPQRLRQLPVPTDMKSLNRVLGFFSYYSPWIQQYSEEIRPLTTTFISREAQNTFENLKKESVVCAIDEGIPFAVETDASDYTIAATLNQNGRPVAFFSRTLHGSEISHASVEKEAKAIIEAIHHWRHRKALHHNHRPTISCLHV